MEFIVLGFYAAWAITNCLIADNQGRNLWLSLVGSILFSPLLVWLYLVASPAPNALEYQRLTVNLLIEINNRGKNT